MIDYDPNDALPGGERLPSLKRRIMLGLLAEQESERLGLRVETKDVTAMARWFREEFDLGRGEDLRAFMSDVGLSREALTEQLRTFCHLVKVQEHYTPAIETMLPDYYAFASLERHGRSS